MGQSANNPSYQPVLDPYGSGVNMPSIGQQQGGLSGQMPGVYQALAGQLAGGGQGNGSNTGVMAAGNAGALGAGQKEASNLGAAQLTQQDFGNRIGQMQAENEPLFEQQQLGAQNNQFNQQQQNSQTAGAVQSGMSLAQLMYILNRNNNSNQNASLASDQTSLASIGQAANSLPGLQ